MSGLHWLALWVGSYSIALVALGTLWYLASRLPCWCGWHRRETVRYQVTRDGRFRLVVACLDCPHERLALDGIVFTPARRYALQPKPKRVA